MGNTEQLSKIILFILIFLSWPTFGAQRGVVTEDQVSVYAEASFDAKVISVVEKGTPVIMSDKVYGAFYKVKVKGVLGYISDVEVKSVGSDSPDIGNKKKDTKLSDQGKKKRKKKPFEETRYVGPIFGNLNFNEDILGDNQHANLAMYGVKMVAPDLITEGPLWDWSLLLYSGAPGYYENVTGKSASGLLLVTDMLILFPVNFASTHMIYFGAGPLFVFSNFNIQAGNTAYSLQQLRMGLSFNLGFSIRAGPAAIRIETKLYKEKYTYSGLFGSVQFEY